MIAVLTTRSYSQPDELAIGNISFTNPDDDDRSLAFNRSSLAERYCPLIMLTHLMPRLAICAVVSSPTRLVTHALSGMSSQLDMDQA